MEKISGISLGRKKHLLKLGSFMVVVFIGFVLFWGSQKIEIYKYTDVKIVAIENNIFLISEANLKPTENIQFKNESIMNISLQKIKEDKYILTKSELSQPFIRELEDNILTEGKIKTGKQNLFQGILPFWGNK